MSQKPGREKKGRNVVLVGYNIPAESGSLGVDYTVEGQHSPRSVKRRRFYLVEYGC